MKVPHITFIMVPEIIKRSFIPMQYRISPLWPPVFFRKGVLPLMFALSYLPFLPACNIINPPEIVPAYIKVDTITLTGNPSTQGFLTHNFGDVWAVLDNEISIAAYELPTVFPVFANGETTITLSPGIRRNGFSNAREAYPMMSFFEVQRNLQPLDTVFLSPSVRYLDDVVFALLENFETGNNFTVSTGSTGSFAITSEPDQIFEGNRSGLISLEGSSQAIELRSTTMVLPDQGGRPVYLELDYRCNLPFDIVVRSTPTGSALPLNSYVVTVAPRADWNKIYIYLTEQLGLQVGALYQVSIQAQGSDSPAQGEILIDNLKILYR